METTTALKWLVEAAEEYKQEAGSWVEFETLECQKAERELDWALRRSKKLLEEEALVRSK